MALPGINTSLPPEIDAEQQRIARQQAVAEAMLQRGMTPLATNQGPIHWTQGLAQMFNSYTGRRGIEDASQARKGVGQQYQQGLADEVKRIAALRRGQTIVPDPQEIEQASDQGTAMPTTTTTGDPRAAIEAALLSQYEPVRQMGVLEHKTFENEQTKKGDREARLHERILALDAAAANQAAAREERVARAAEAADLRRELAKMQDQTRRDIAAMRPDPAPSVSEVVDPKDSTRMLRIDTRTYKGGTLGDAGVLGVSGKEPAAQRKAEMQEGGRRQVTEILNTLNDRYNELEKQRGVISNDRTAAANVATRIASSGVGQTVLGAVGTKPAAEREKIEMARPLLMQAIRQATGMSAKAMDSNMELKFYIQAATDPTKSIQANRAALALLDKTYGLGMGIRADEKEMRTLEQQAKGGAQPNAQALPQGVTQKEWDAMTLEEKALFQ